MLLGTDLKWTAASAGTDVSVKLSAKDVGTDLTLSDLPSQMETCVGGGLIACSPQAPQVVLVDPGIFSDDTYVVFQNDFTAFTTANGTIHMSGKVCLPPTDDDGDPLSPPGTVYGTCIAGTAPNRIEIDNLRLKNARLEMATGDSDSKDEDGDPIEDDLMKLYVDTDFEGIKIDKLHVRNDTSDSTTDITAGDPPLRNRNSPSGSFAPFSWLFDLSVPPSTEDQPHTGQLQCGGLDVFVDLPILGATDVIPGLGEFFLGDICFE